MPSPREQRMNLPTCKTCTHFHSTAFFCRAMDESVAEWDRCDGHETYEEMVSRVQSSEVKTQ